MCKSNEDRLMNNKYKTETHLHVSEVSPCSWIDASEMIKRYFEAGYKTVFVSDHFTSAYMNALGDISWKEKISEFLSGYYKAKTTGDELGVNVLMSAEISFAGSPNHYLVYGITQGFLNMYPYFNENGIENFSEIAKKHNVFIIQAHPYRDGICFPTPDYVDGIEVYNSNARHEDFSEKVEKLAAELAAEYNLFVSAGSDAHREEDVAQSGIITEQEIKTVEDFISVIKNGEFEIIRRK